MEEQLISFECAKLAKELGFNQKCDKVYSGIMKIPQIESYNETRWKLYDDYCKAYSQSLLQRWLREEKRLIVQVYFNGDENFYFFTQEYKSMSKDLISSLDDLDKFHWPTYEEALENALIETLKYLQNEQAGKSTDIS